MRNRIKLPDKQAFRKCWGRWTAIVELFARRRVARKRLDPREYTELHHELISRCRALAASANDVEAAYYRYLEDLAQPWLDLATLDRGERDILYDLLIRCRQVEAHFGGRLWWRRVPAGLIALVLFASFFAIMLSWMGKFSVLLRTILEYSRDGLDTLYLRAVYSSEFERLFMVGCVLIAVSIYAVSRTAKS
jgi:hypothetical protein